jgi:hypothetical protein
VSWWRRTPKERSQRWRMPMERGGGDESGVSVDESAWGQLREDSRVLGGSKSTRAC